VKQSENNHTKVLYYYVSLLKNELKVKWFFCDLRVPTPNPVRSRQSRASQLETQHTDIKYWLPPAGMRWGRTACRCSACSLALRLCSRRDEAMASD